MRQGWSRRITWTKLGLLLAWGPWISWRFSRLYRYSLTTSCGVFRFRSCFGKVFREAKLQSLVWRRLLSKLPSKSCFDRLTCLPPKTTDRIQTGWWQLHCVEFWLEHQTLKAHPKLPLRCFIFSEAFFHNNGHRIVGALKAVIRPKPFLLNGYQFFCWMHPLESQKIIVPVLGPSQSRYFRGRASQATLWYSCSRFLHTFWRVSCHQVHDHGVRPVRQECKASCFCFWRRCLTWCPKLCMPSHCMFFSVLLKGNLIRHLILSTSWMY